MADLESEIVKRFVLTGPFKDWICLPEFPIGIQVLWNAYRNEAMIKNLLKRIDLLFVQPVQNDNLERYKAVSDFLCHINKIQTPYSRMNLRLWRQWSNQLAERKAWVIEAKSNASVFFGALGQVLTYSELFQTDYPRTKLLGRGIVLDKQDAVISCVCEKLKVEIFAVN